MTWVSISRTAPETKSKSGLVRAQIHTHTHGFLIAFIPQWPLAPGEPVMVLASPCCDTGTAEPPLPAGTPQNGLGSWKTPGNENKSELTMIYLSSVTALCFCCLPCDCEQPPEEWPWGCNVGVGEDDEGSSFRWRLSPSPRAVWAHLQWEVEAGVQLSPLCIFSCTLKLGNSKQNQQILQYLLTASYF